MDIKMIEKQLLFDLKKQKLDYEFFGACIKITYSGRIYWNYGVNYNICLGCKKPEDTYYDILWTLKNRKKKLDDYEKEVLTFLLDKLSQYIPEKSRRSFHYSLQ